MFNILDALKHLFVIATTTIAVLNPFNIPLQKNIDISPTPTEIIFQLTPTPIPTTDPDPIIDCESGYPNCKGSSIKVHQSQCSKITCCGFNDGSWKLIKKEDCDIAQKQDVSPRQNNNATNIDCIGPDGKHSQKTQKECDDFNAAWRKPQQANRNNVPNNQSGTVNCQTKSGWVSVTKEECVRLQDGWKQDILKDVIRQQDQQLNLVLALEREAYVANTLDQLDNIRERLRWIKTSDSYAQDYINSVIGYIEARIKILQQQ